MKLRHTIMELPTASVVEQLPPGLTVLAGSTRIDFCLELFDPADQSVLYRALNGSGVAIPGTGLAVRIVPWGTDKQKVEIAQAGGQEPTFPQDWLARIHSTAGNVLIWVGEICAARKVHVNDQLQAEIANYDRVPGGWRRR